MTQVKGLTTQEVKQSRIQHGENVLTPVPRTPWYKLFLEKFSDPIVKILIAAAVLSFAIGFIHNEFAEAIGIVFAIIMATGIAFWFEFDAGKKFDLLNRVQDETAVRVLRNGQVVSVSKKEIVVGDMVLIETGEEIPADGILLESISLMVNESSLTGEPSANKHVGEQEKGEEAYPANMVLRGTTVLGGNALYQVTQVGDATEIGKVARASSIDNSLITPLNKQLDRLSGIISKVAFLVSIVLFLALCVKAFVAGDFTDWTTMKTWEQLLGFFMVAVTLIVVCVPEGLPMSVTLSMALSMRKMLSQNVLIRKMHASETMGATTVICTDKTGTLTQNQMSVQALKSYTKDLHPILRMNMAVNSTAHIGEGEAIGNPTESALLFWLSQQGLDYKNDREMSHLDAQLSFSTERKFMATVVTPLSTLDFTETKKLLLIKGAPEIVMQRCSGVHTDEGIQQMHTVTDEMQKFLLDYQRRAMRTLAFAYAWVEVSDEMPDWNLICKDLTFLGAVAIQDPVRPDVPAAVAQCMNAGIQIKIVTGDTSATAIEIGRQIGLWKDNEPAQAHMTGPEFAAASDKDILKHLHLLKIMSRARPQDKQRLVQLLQTKGEVVAVTGDGTNDAPALNFANVGLSMGSGTSVAKEASAITLMDDSFQSIATAVLWGRSLYKNIQRFLLFQLIINLVALTVVFVGSLMDAELPLTVTQMLWVNLIMDTFAAAALASLPPDSKYMNEKPRKSNDFILSKSLLRQLLFYSIFFIVILMTFLTYLKSDDGLLSVLDLTRFFTFFVLIQFWNLFNVRVFGTKSSAFVGLWNSKPLLGIALLIIIGQVIIVNFGGAVFRVIPISTYDWLFLFVGSSLVLWFGQILRWLKIA